MPDSPRLIFENNGGLNTLLAADLIPQGQFAFLQNARRLLGGRIVARPPLGNNLIASPLAAGVTSLTRMNDPYLPGYVLIESAAGKVYVNASQVLSGLSGNPVSFLPYRPASSPQPWCYIGDVNGMWKVRSDGTAWKDGIAEPQIAPGVTSPGGGFDQVVYRYSYRSSATGAKSNPSPESMPVATGALNAAALAAVNHYSPTQFTNYSSGATGGTMNGQWTSAYASYTQFATITNGGPGGLLLPIQTQNPSNSGFGASAYPVPPGSTITGIQFQLNWLNQPSGQPGTLVNCQLSYHGSLIGTQKSPGIASTGVDPGGVFNAGTLVGADGDTWGATLTDVIVNDPTFGVNFQIFQGTGGSSNKLYINVVYIVIYWSVPDSVLQATGSTDPQVDVIDYYREGAGLLNFTYVGTGPNGIPPPAFTDTVSDATAELNPVLEFDNYEPFPSIDLPRKGTCNVGANGAITWVSGDHFNVRWLPGNIVLIAGIAYLLYNRPSDTTHMLVYTTMVSGSTIVFGYPPTGSNISFSLLEPTLAAEPSPVIWGPTPDNAGSFAFGLDPNNPGDLVWTKGNDFDSAPDTNRLSVTSPSEPLMNGTVTSELSTVFSTERFWLIYPNFSDAVATVSGTTGQQWTLVQSAAKRGLYMRYAIAALGSLIAWRAKDGIFVSQGGGPDQEISGSIYNLFPHGGQLPQPVTIGTNTVYPPDDTKPNAQTMTMTPGYIFYDYQDVNGVQQTLVYDSEAKGWGVDAYSPKVNCHAWSVGQVFQILAGCVDGTVRALDSTGSESGNAIVATPSGNGGSPRTTKRLGGVFVRARAAVGIALQFWSNRYGSQITGFSPSTLGTSGVEADYLVDFSSATNADVLDLGAVFSFPLGSGDWLKEMQFDFTQLPQQISAWRTGMVSLGLEGWLFVPWLRFAYTSTAQVNLTITTDQGASFTVAIPSSAGKPAKFFAWCPSISGGVSTKFKLLEWSADASGTPWTCYANDIEVAVRQWGETSGFHIIRPFSGEGFGVPGSTT